MSTTLIDYNFCEVNDYCILKKQFELSINILESN